MSKRLFLAAALVISGVAVLSGPAFYRNDLIQTALNPFDLQDRRCRKASVAKGVACPDGCVARPPKGPEERNAVPECRSKLWNATCGTACDPRKGLVRLEDGRFASSGTIIVDFEGVSDDAYDEAILALGAESEPVPSGMFRYAVKFNNPLDDRRRLDRMRDAIRDIPKVIAVEYEYR